MPIIRLSDIYLGGLGHILYFSLLHHHRHANALVDVHTIYFTFRTRRSNPPTKELSGSVVEVELEYELTRATPMSQVK